MVLDLEIYKNSLSEEDEIEKAETLITYFRNKREGLILYQERGLNLPENKQGLVYRNMGTMENHVWSVIAKRMKHNHTSWSIKGGNNLAKILAKKCSGRLDEVVSKLKLKMPVFEKLVAEQIEKDILMAGKVQKKCGKGYEYPAKGSLPYLYESVEGSIHQMWECFAGM